MGNKVDFFIVGCQKGGTVSMAYNLNQHPNIHVPEGEPHFFDRLHFTPEYNRYHSKFKLGGNKVNGESTPSNGFIGVAIDRIVKYNPDAKFIYLLREPVSRAYSQWNMYKQGGRIKESFSDFFHRDEVIDLSEIKSNGMYPQQRGFYHEHIKHILTKVDSENLLILISENVRKNSEQNYLKILKFLNVNPHPNLISVQEKHVRKYSSEISRSNFMMAKEVFDKHNEKLYNLLGYEIKEWETKYEQFR